MRTVMLFGATGNLGKEIARELIGQGYDLTVVVRSELKAKSLSHITSKYIVADPCNELTLEHIFDKQEIVISALGKSVSPNDRSKPGFRDVDYYGNLNILRKAKEAGIKKFVYVSAFHSENYLHLEYFKVHHEFSELLIQSGMDYSIIKPPAIFSAFIDMIEMAKKGQLVNIGDGNKKTNPIYEGDLAEITVAALDKPYSIIEAGGPNIYTRRQLNEIVQEKVGNQKKIRTVPIGLFKLSLPIIKVFSKNMYDKFAFFIEVMQHDTIAPKLGKMSFEDYIELKTHDQKGKSN